LDGVQFITKQRGLSYFLSDTLALQKPVVLHRSVLSVRFCKMLALASGSDVLFWPSTTPRERTIAQSSKKLR
ncbi:hypothetical protein ABEX47_07675, partial [Paenibacillus ehimensis]|uniref:hypothetical protein n=1 Tax=Paenibacillus ehimensis TaxID=79264 RepID=UPI003D283FEC